MAPSKFAKYAPVGVYPLFAIMAVAAGGASWYLVRLARNPDVAWVKSKNPHPWLTIEQGTTTKILDPSGHFEGKTWKRGFY